jgi:hypothetical protein
MEFISNVGIGNVEATFENLTTTAAAGQNAFTASMLDAGRCAAYLVGNNEIGHDTAVHPLFGAVKAVSDDERYDGQPRRAVVQIFGVAEIMGTTHSGSAPAVNETHEAIAFDGFVALTTTTAVGPIGSHRSRIINVFDTDRCHVMLG